MSDRTKKSPRKRRAEAVERLLNAADLLASAKGEAQWTNGYRTAARVAPAEDYRLYQKETTQWSAVERERATLRRLVMRALREASHVR